ncbi:hypothetical protein [Streptomyces sp. NPDC002853]
MTLELGTEDPRRRKATPRQQRCAAIRIADAIAAEYPQEPDGRRLGQDPVIAAGLRELLAALGLDTKTSKEAP